MKSKLGNTCHDDDCHKFRKSWLTRLVPTFLHSRSHYSVTQILTILAKPGHSDYYRRRRLLLDFALLGKVAFERFRNGKFSSKSGESNFRSSNMARNKLIKGT